MNQYSLFSDSMIDPPSTEGIKYAGSKLRLIPQIINLISRVRPKTVLDGFSGTTRVSQALAKLGYGVICNDVSAWSEIFGRCYLLNTRSREHYQPIIDHLNAAPPVDGWFTRHYGGLPNGGLAVQADGRKKPWQVHNTRKLDAIRQEIDVLGLDPVERAVALASLVLALDRVDNSLGHFASYLRDWSPRSYKTLELAVPRVLPATARHQVFRRDIFDLAPDAPADLAYLDPPYGSNNEKMPPSRVRYASYYHLWTSVVLFDKPKLFGQASRRIDTSDGVASSVFEDFRRDDKGRFVAVEAIDDLIGGIRARHVVLSYSSGGRATAGELNDVMRRHGDLLEVVRIDHRKNVMAGMKWTNEWLSDANRPNREFLFLLEKRRVWSAPRRIGRAAQVVRSSSPLMREGP